MRDDKNTPDYQVSSTLSSESPSITDFERGIDSETEFDSYPVPSSADIPTLEARLLAAEARKAAGLETEEASNVLKARLELAKAKSSLEQEHQFSTPDVSFGTGQSVSKKNQTLTAARILQPSQKDNPLANWLQYTSSICAVAGGVLLSSNTSVSKYGFILLACSSSQIFLSSMMLKQTSLMIYGASLFILVDCLGIYRWLLTGAS